uniref:Putative secreted protein n=1 Tax=Ixodes ricinus TaxID=34613 RepID=A0A6B0UF00_IXORI
MIIKHIPKNILLVLFKGTCMAAPYAPMPTCSNSNANQVPPLPYAPMPTCSNSNANQVPRCVGAHPSLLLVFNHQVFIRSTFLSCKMNERSTQSTGKNKRK